ncbi:hypothetical protein Mapa_011301 [Marchantia paleacea]|nr:hypothetical protein Mapa_011301 [Marchantia paleacea]
MKLIQEASPMTPIYTVYKMAVWRAVQLLSCVTLFAVLLLVDWRGPSLQFQAWIRETESASTDAAPACVQTRAKHSFGSEKIQLERGEYQILHNWSDDELLERAEEMEVQLQLQREEASSSISDDDSAIDKLNGGTREMPSKIAFLFLTTTGIPLEPLWRRFFQGHERSYNIYVHSDPSWLRDHGSHRNLGMFWGRTVPAAVTHRSNPDVVAAERRLIANALHDDRSNEWFVLVSDTCIPLRSFGYMYRRLSATSNSLIDCGKGAPGPLMMSRYRARGDQAMLPEVPFSEFRLGLQFFAIRRRHAVMVIRDRKYWPKFNQPCVRPACYPDEHYIQTVIGNLDEPACQGTPTFLSWNGSKGGHPQSFGREETTPQLIQALQASQNSRFLFARKFKWDALEPLLDLGHLLFNRSNP